MNESAVAGTANEKRYSGMTTEELAEAPTVYRDGLLDGKTVVISGGGSGMGRAMAFLSARLGPNVVLCGRRAERLAKVKDDSRRLVGKEISFTPLSIRDAEVLESFIESAFNRFGPISVLINSAVGSSPRVRSTSRARAGKPSSTPTSTAPSG
jgi:NAD(P)-dependent dehydrogenase (short-subunit alcohol dehydrogenase family)